MIGAWAKTNIERKVAFSFSEKKIGDYNNNDMKSITRLLGEWWILSGVNQDANAKDLIIIGKFIHNNYPQLTYTDIFMSMTLSIKGELELSYEPFVRLSGQYISKCVNAYLIIKAKIVNDAVAKTDEYYKRQELERPAQPTTPQQRMESFASILETSYNMAHESSIVLDFESRIYTWLRSTKQIKMSQPDVDEALKKGKERYAKVYGNKHNKQPDDSIIKKFGREHAVVKYFLETPITVIMDYLKIEYFIS